MPACGGFPCQHALWLKEQINIAFHHGQRTGNFYGFLYWNRLHRDHAQNCLASQYQFGSGMSTMNGGIR